MATTLAATGYRVIAVTRKCTTEVEAAVAVRGSNGAMNFRPYDCSQTEQLGSSGRKTARRRRPY